MRLSRRWTTDRHRRTYFGPTEAVAGAPVSPHEGVKSVGYQVNAGVCSDEPDDVAVGVDERDDTCMRGVDLGHVVEEGLARIVIAGQEAAIAVGDVAGLGGQAQRWRR